MRWRSRWLLLSLCALPAVIGAARAEDETPSPATVAQRVRAAFEAEDDTTLAALAQQAFPDPWLTCQVLLAEGAFDAAQAFATQVPEGPRGGLLTEVAAWRTAPEADAVARVIAKAIQVQRADRHAEALALLEGIEPRRALTVVSVAYQRALLLTWVRDEPEEIVAAFAACHRLAEEARWPDMRTRAAHWAGVYSRNGRSWREAAAWFQAARESAQGTSPAEVLLAILRDLATVQVELAELEQAWATLGTAVEIATANALPYETAYALYLLGDVEASLERFDSAIANLRRAIAGFHALERRDGVVGARISLGRALRDAGHLLRAQEPLRAAVAMARSGGMKQAEGAARRMLGGVLLQTGELARALALFDEALALARASDDAVDEAAALHARGEALYVLQDPEAALEALQAALRLKMELKRGRDAARTLALIAAIQRAVGDPEAAWVTSGMALTFTRDAGDRNGERALLALRAQLRMGRGEWAAAKQDLETALRLAREAADLRTEAWTLWGLALHAVSQGRPGAATEPLAAATGIFRRLLHRLGLIHAAYLRARVALAQADPRLALTAVAEAQAELRRLQAGLDDAHAVSVREVYASLTQYGVEAAAAIGEVGTAFRVLEGGRAGALLQALGGREALLERIMPAGLRDAATGARVAEARALQELSLALARGNAVEAAAAQRRATAARTQLDEAIERMREAAPQAADVTFAEPIALEALRAILRPDEAYVAFALASASGHALVVTRADARLVEIADADQLLAQMQRLRLDSPGLLDRKGLAAVRAKLAMALDLPPSATRLLLSPGAALASFPFAVLLPERELVYVPSATTHALLRRDGERRGTGVLAVGDPAHPKGAVLAGIELVALPHARKEAEAVGDVVLTGRDATRPALLAAMRSRTAWSAVHIACHAVIDDAQPRRSTLALAPTAADDGRLTVDDVFGLRIPADLAVLSACESGLGRVRRGEGIMGFTRAFLLAGAPRVLVSLWRVDDEATSALMRRFHAIWKTPRDGKRVPTATALREAQAWMRTQERWRHPYYWAGFALFGLGD